MPLAEGWEKDPSQRVLSVGHEGRVPLGGGSRAQFATVTSCDISSCEDCFLSTRLDRWLLSAFIWNRAHSHLPWFVIGSAPFFSPKDNCIFSIQNRSIRNHVPPCGTCFAPAVHHHPREIARSFNMLQTSKSASIRLWSGRAAKILKVANKSGDNDPNHSWSLWNLVSRKKVNKN